MIDFRYHVVSIVAVLLALTVGLVLGSSFLGQAVLDNLHHQVNNLNTENNSLRSTQTQDEAQLRYRDAVINTMAPELVANQLTGHNVLVVSLPGASTSVASDTITMLQSAGAKVSTQLTVQGSYTASASQRQLSTVANAHVPSGSQPTGDPQSQAAADLASVMVGHQQTSTGTGGGKSTSQPPTTTASSHGQPTPGNSPSTSPTPDTTPTPVPDEGKTLDAFVNAGFVSVKGDTTNPADLVVVVAGAPNGSSSTATQQNADYLDLLRAFGNAGDGTVLAGTTQTAVSPGLITAVLADDWTTKHVSSVDTADLPAGQAAVVLALADELGGQVGHYGMTGTTDGPMPKLTTSGSQGSS